MIEVSAETACILYLGTAIFTIMTIWLYQYIKNSRKEILSFTTKHFVCEFCHSSYLDNPNQSMTRCPQCQSLNKSSTKR